MKFHRKIVQTIDVKYLGIRLPVRYGDENIPYDAPMRNGDVWYATIDIDAGKVVNWPQGKTLNMHMKVCDSGIYTLYTAEGTELEEIACIEGDYVPNSLVPGEYGDYVHLNIDATGKITNWPANPNLADFYKEDE